MNTILIRYSEIALKKRRRSWFEKILVNNIKDTLKNNLKSIRTTPGRIFVEVRNTDLAIKNLKKVFGIKSLSPCLFFEFKDLENLVKKSEEFFKDKVLGKKFKVDCNRVGEHNFTSYDIRCRVGEVLSKYGKVDIKNPEIICYIEVRDKNAYLFTDIIECYGGLPVGSEGKVLALVSGGFDSPVAAWTMMKRGAKIDILYCNIGGNLEEYFVLKVINKLLEWSYGYNNEIFIARCENVIRKIMKNVKEGLWIIVYRRFLYSLAEKIVEKIDAKGIITGESLGQKSSQTLENIYSAEYGIKIPIFRPLIGLDKDEIVKLSRKVGTYDLSKDVPEFCALLSEKPRTWSTKEEIEEEFKKIEHLLNNVKVDVYTKDNISERIEELRNILSVEIQEVSEEDVKNSIIIYLGRKKVPNTIIMGVNEAEEFIRKSGKDKRYILVCKEGLTAYWLTSKLIKEGYQVKSCDEETLLKLIKKNPNGR